MEHVFVERRLSKPLTMEQVRESTCATEVCFKLHRVRHLRTAISSDGLRAICEFEAPDAESVRRAQRDAKLPYEAIWTAQVFEAGPSEPGV